MRRIGKWVGITSAIVAGIVVLGVTIAYAASSFKINRRFEVVPDPISVRNDPRTVSHGERLSRIHGCNNCHGSDLSGGVLIDTPLFGRFVAPNLTRIRHEYSDLDFVRAIRHGIRPDGRSLFSGMPSASYSFFADDDLGAIIAYLRSVPDVENGLPSRRFGPMARWMVLSRAMPMAPEIIEHSRSPLPTSNRNSPEAFGEYLASTICTECHGLDLLGQDSPMMVTPSLAIVFAYSEVEFRRLMREGIGLGDRELGMMTGVARSRFANYTDGEITALYAYLSDLPAGS